MEYQEFVQSPKQIMPRKYEKFIGLDVDKKNISVTVLNWKGIEARMTVPNKPESFVRYMQKKYDGVKIAFVYEAGPTGYGLFDALYNRGYDCLVTAPALVPQAPNQKRVKTNRLDSDRLATRLRGGELQGIRVPSPLYRDLRHYARRYFQLTTQCIRVKQRIKALLLMEGTEFPAKTGRYTKDVLQALAGILGREAVKSLICSHVKELESILTMRKALLKEVRHFIRSHEDLKRNMGFLCSLPGVGRKIAFLTLARIGDWRLISNVDEVPSFLGLCSSEHSTGDRVRRGGITRTGDRQVRSMLIESAWIAIRRDKELQEFYQRLGHEGKPGENKRKALTAVTRKLAERMGTVLKGQRNYVIREEICRAV